MSLLSLEIYSTFPKSLKRKRDFHAAGERKMYVTNIFSLFPICELIFGNVQKRENCTFHLQVGPLKAI